MRRHTRLLLVRHGQTTAGDHVFLGSRSDPGLSDKGRKQAEHLRSCLSTYHPAAIVASPLRRACETAALAAPGAAVRIDERIREVDYGLFSGLTVAEVESQYPDELRAWQQEAVTPPEAEALESVAMRSIRAVFDHMGGLRDGEDIVFVTHNLPIRVLMASARGRSLKEWRQVRATHGGVRSVLLTPAILARWQSIPDRI